MGGYKVTSKTNSHSIFLRAAGYYDEDDDNVVGSVGYYWTSTKDDENYGICWSFDESFSEKHFCKKYKGLSVRPVAEKP